MTLRRGAKPEQLPHQHTVEPEPPEVECRPPCIEVREHRVGRLPRKIETHGDGWNTGYPIALSFESKRNVGGDPQHTAGGTDDVIPSPEVEGFWRRSVEVG